MTLAGCLSNHAEAPRFVILTESPSFRAHASERWWAVVVSDRWGMRTRVESRGDLAGSDLSLLGLVRHGDGVTCVLGVLSVQTFTEVETAYDEA